MIHRLGAEAPKKSLVENYMIEIARNYKVDYEPDPSMFLVSCAAFIVSRWFLSKMFPFRRMISFQLNLLLLLSHFFPTMSHRDGEEEEEEEELALYHRKRSLATSTPHDHNHPLPHSRSELYTAVYCQHYYSCDFVYFIQYGGASLPPAYPGPPTQPPPPVNPGLPYVSHVYKY